MFGRGTVQYHEEKHVSKVCAQNLPRNSKASPTALRRRARAPRAATARLAARCQAATALATKKLPQTKAKGIRMDLQISV